jgi:hypothetical protein
VKSPLAVRLVVGAQVGFVLGLCSHLVLDMIQYGDIRWLSGDTFGKLWLALHSVLLALVAWSPPYARHHAFSLRSTQ